MFSIALYGLLACLAVQTLASLALRRLARRPTWIVGIYTLAATGVWLFAFVAILMASMVIATIVVVVAALCLLVLSAERRRKKATGKPPDRSPGGPAT